MTEERWPTIEELLAQFYSEEVGLRTSRKRRLFAAAACRSIARWLYDPRCLQAIEVAEAYCDGVANGYQLEEARAAARFDTGPATDSRQMTLIGLMASAATHWICDEDYYKLHRSPEAVPGVYGYAAAIRAGLLDESTTEADADDTEIRNQEAWREGVAQGERVLAELLREIARPTRARVKKAIRIPQVLSLAQAAYEGRSLPAGHLDPARLAVLADALEDAGCTDFDILSHLRSPGPHVRGCWALDLILNRE